MRPLTHALELDLGHVHALSLLPHGINQHPFWYEQRVSSTNVYTNKQPHATQKTTSGQQDKKKKTEAHRLILNEQHSTHNKAASGSIMTMTIFKKWSTKDSNDNNERCWCVLNGNKEIDGIHIISQN